VTGGASGDVGGAKAVILAGGRGTRLAPYTSVLPKPLMPIGDRAILEIVVHQLAGHGFTEVVFCVGYLSHLIRAVFDSRQPGGVRIRYAQEDNPLGTAAPLRLIDGLDETFLMMNGDVLTTIDYGDFIRYHREHGNVLTVATRERTIKVDYGVLRVNGHNGSRRVNGWEEKPEVVSTVSMGIYALEPRALQYIPESGYFDLPELVQALLQAEEPVGAYAFDGVWFDIGRQDDYQKAVAAWAESDWEESVYPGGSSANGNGHAAANGNGHVAASGDGNAVVAHGLPATARRSPR
jgi:NDP-sugar pyrophosphorylase family protein